MNQFLSKLPLIVMVGGAVILIVVALVFVGILPGKVPSKPKEATLEFWDMGYMELPWIQIVGKFRERYPHISVNYLKIDERDYESALVNAIAEGRGPDIFMLKNSWVQKHEDKIFSLPQPALNFTSIDFTRTFVDAAADDLISVHGDILGLPLFVDTPALFYNKDAFNTATVPAPPRTWGDVEALAHRFSKISRAGDVIESGMAMGTARNTDRAFEIITSIIFQFKDAIVKPRTAEVILREGARDALSLYTSFADPAMKHYSWSGRLTSSLNAFAEGTAVMAIGLSEDLFRVRARNPHVSIGVAALPQREGATTATVYGSYAFPTVSRFSRSPNEAWQFLLYVAAGEGAPLYLKETRRPPARRDLISLGAPLIEFDPYWRQVLIARSWPVPDDGATRRLFHDAIESVVSKANGPSEAIQLLLGRISQLVNR